MAIAITLLYILAELIGPSTLFGPLAEYRIELFVALFAMLTTVPSLFESGIFTSRMTFALGGLAFAVVMSVALAGWLGAVPTISYGLLPVLLGFVLVAVNCKTKRHLQLVILALFVGCVFDIVNGALALQQSTPSPYIYVQGYEGNLLPRIRGLEFLNDPNDFAQLLVSLLPLLFFFWKKGSSFRNLFLLPSALAFLLWGMYLTRSRGGTLALMATVVLAAKRKVGLVPAAVVGALILLGALAVGASGGREISSESGADRIELWAIGLGLVKTHFFFGVGVSNFWNYAPNTAHNSVVICAAELGVVGLLFWVMFILSAIRGAVLLERDAPALIADEEKPFYNRQTRPTPQSLNTVAFAQADPVGTSSYSLAAKPFQSRASAPQRSQPVLPTPPEPFANPFLPTGDAAQPAKLPDEEVRRLARLLLYSLTGFLAAGWFLSRALSIWLFIYCGMMHVVLRLAAANNIQPPRDGLAFLFRWSAVIAAFLLMAVSLIVRFSH